MLLQHAVLLSTWVALANAHFQLQFPTPWGPFVEDDEPTFCDGYKPSGNRSTFPLTGGFFSLNSEHTQWTAGVLVSTAANPTSFDNFTQLDPFFSENGEGLFCFPLNFTTSANATSFANGQNVTIQIVFNGGDGQLYQCADLTLSSNYQIASDVKCSNATSTNVTSTSSASPVGAVGKNFSAGLTILIMFTIGLILL